MWLVISAVGMMDANWFREELYSWNKSNMAPLIKERPFSSNPISWCRKPQQTSWLPLFNKDSITDMCNFCPFTGTLLPRLPSEPGMTLLTIKIEKIGLKDAGQCIDPYVTISVKGTEPVLNSCCSALDWTFTYCCVNADLAAFSF